jgi:hypothetical protein
MNNTQMALMDLCILPRPPSRAMCDDTTPESLSVTQAKSKAKVEQVFDLMLRHGAMPSSEIVALTGYSASRITDYLNTLRGAGRIKSQRRGSVFFYTAIPVWEERK